MSIPTPNTQSLNSIVDVVVEISPLAAPRPTFNQALFIGPSAYINSQTTRLKKYDSNFASEMVADGFAITNPEYIAMGIYMSQNPQPTYGWIGRQDLTAIATATIDSGNEGTGYVVGDVLTVGGGTGGTVKVTTVSSGAITGISIVTQGTGYSVANSITTTGGTGTGAKVDVTAIGETFLQAAQYCRAANFDWYAFMCLGAAKADHEAIATWVQTALPSSVYFYTTGDSDVLNGVADNIGLHLQALLYNRSLGQYSTTQGGVYPNNIYASAAILGYAMGQNTGLANSAYTLKFKQEIGIAVEPLTLTQINNIESANINAYLSYGNYYDIFEQGVMADGQFFDEIINLDMLINAIQLNVMDLLYGNAKIPQTDPGVTQIIHAINQACDKAVTLGFLAPGAWTGSNILNLSTGDPLPKGYLVQAASLASQSNSDRQARKSPPIYVAIKEAGAIHSILVGVYVNR